MESMWPSSVLPRWLNVLQEQENPPIVLMALVDAEYKFIDVDCGANGYVSDGGVFAATSLREALEDGTIGLPAPVVTHLYPT